MHLPPSAPWISWPTLVATWGPGSLSASHAHHAAHMIVALEGMLRVELQGTEPRPAAGVFVPPDVPHRIDARSARILMIFVDPESAAGRAVVAHWETTGLLLDPTEIEARIPDDVRCTPSAVTVTRWLETIGAERLPSFVAHPGIRRVLRCLRDGTLDRDSVSASALANEAGLSVSRFLHVFKEVTGTTLRRYLLWLRVQRAAGSILSAHDLSRVAHETGFSDASHMSRTFRRMWGVTPSELRALGASVRSSTHDAP